MSTDPGDGSLGRFLQASRARLTPAVVGIRSAGSSRRVPGLKREELAMLAGVSASYYTRLEQGQAVGASVQVLDALATALLLNDAEREHLHRLASVAARPRRPERTPPERVDPTVATLVHGMTRVPAIVLGRRRDILAWNPLGHALLAGHLDAGAPMHWAERPNATELVFLDPHTRDLYVDWPLKARATVGHLRILTARFPDDPQLAALVGRLSIASPEFAVLWGRHQVKSGDPIRYDLQHPLAGRLSVVQQHLVAAQAPEQTVVACTPADAAATEALALLSQLIGAS